MLTLILIHDQYVQNVVLSFQKTLNGQNHLSDSHRPTKKFPQQNFPSPPSPPPPPMSFIRNGTLLKIKSKKLPY